ncbi:MAG: glycosyltransferase [Acidimicrobiia bacterium]
MSETIAILWAECAATAFIPTISSLRAAHPDLIVLLGGPGDRSGFRSVADVKLVDGSLTETVGAHGARHVLVVTAPVIVPPGFLDRAIAALDDDVRLASVSFLSNAAGPLSVPERNRPVLHQVGTHDEVSITRQLRTASPEPKIVPLAAPTGAAVLLSKYALGATGGIDAASHGTAEFLIADHALRSANRGFINTVDEGTYVTRAFDLADYRPHPIDDPSQHEYGYLTHRYPTYIDRHERDRESTQSTLASVVSCASAKIRGLRIIIDGSDIGPKEMGTQVQILSLVRELARREDVHSVQLGIPGELPGYAVPFLESGKIRVFAAPGADVGQADAADVIHRPSQPSHTLPFAQWRDKAARTVVTLQDLIAFQVGAYHASGEAWDRYRGHLVSGVHGADGVVSISAETVRHIQSERLPLEPSRLFVVPNGTDHLNGSESETFPTELGRRGFVSEEFLLVIGTNYGHKNRDLAIRAWRLLRHSHPNLALVLAGAFVPSGSSRLAEADASIGVNGGMFVLPDVSSVERNWLLRHCRAVVYPTSAEGFGLVPFEAARFGSPTVAIGFRPLTEFNEQPVWATGWSPEELSTAIGRLLEDPTLAAAQVAATLRNADAHRWSDTAEGLVHAYRTVLSLPAPLRS